MPQIAQIGEIYASQLFWLAVTFGLIFFVIGLGMLPKIQSTVDARDARIASDLAEAEKARHAADQLEEEYRQAMDRAAAKSSQQVAEAKAEAAQETEGRLAKADSELEAQLQQAQGRIREAREVALAELEGVAAEATAQMVERVAGLSIDSATARTAVKRELVNG